MQTENNIQKLENAHQDMMMFFNAMDEVFFSVDAVNLKVIQISNGCEKLYGHKAAEFIANPRLWFELMLPEDRHIVADEDDILRSGGKVNKQYRIARKDGAIRWVENKIIPGFDENGRWVRVDGMTWDITARKEAEEKQRQDEAKYRRIVETAQEGIWTIDENNVTNFVNQKMGDILGYAPEEMIGKYVYDFIEKDGQADTINRIEKRRNGSRENADIKLLTKKGEIVWANVSANPILDENGEYKGSIGMLTDITQRKKDEEALKKSEANLRTVFDNTESSYILINSDLKIVSFNAVAQQYNDVRSDKRLEINHDVKDYFSEERWPVIEDIITRVAKGEIVTYELCHTKDDGTVLWNTVRWINIKNNNNESWGLILTSKDITVEKIAELERERITADLIQHIKDLEQFTYIISHNLRAPVANIIGLSDMLMDEDLEPDDKQEIIERVSRSINNIDSVIDDLNHILQSRQHVNEQKDMVFFQDLVDAIKISIHNTIVNEHVQIKCSFDEVGSIFTIRSYLYSIFYNLSSNSIKYRQPGVSPVISINSKKFSDKIELRFKDNGKGIDLDKNAGELFGLYKRFDTSMEGKGMGLFMVKAQVEALGGSIDIKSELGVGTEFIMQFPINLVSA